MLWFFYNICFIFVYPLLLPYYIFRMLRRGGYGKGFFQRVGIYESRIVAGLKDRRRYWIHAVSVGEMFVGARLMNEMRKLQPDASFVVTTTTSTGHAIAEKKITEHDVLVYFPVDFPPIMKRVFSLFNPLAVILIESELWPNLIRTAKNRHIPVILANGRISEKSFHGYMKVRQLVSRVLAMLDLLLAQGTADAERLEKLGADPEKILILGSSKYDDAEAMISGIEPPAAILEKAGISPETPLIVAGSTWPGEEEIMLSLLKRVSGKHPDAALVIAPRHVERAAEVIGKIKQSGFSWVRRSGLNETAPVRPAKVLLVDTTGELQKFYVAATVIFVGKSLTRKGGQNIIEAAAFGKPVIVGPHTENFKSVIDDFLSASAITVVATPSELEEAVLNFLNDAQLRDEYGKRAVELIRKKSGVAPATAKIILELAKR